MATATVGEYPSGPPNGMQTIKPSSCLARQVIPVGAGSNASQPFGGDTKSIRLWSDTKLAWRIGTGTPTALTTDEGFSAGQTEYFTVSPGESVAVILLP